MAPLVLNSLVWAHSVLAIAALAQWPECSGAADGHAPFNGTNGTYGPLSFHESSWEGSPLYAIVPAGTREYPLVVFMHGSTGEYEMYADNLRVISTHGFVVVFPFIKSPQGDKSPLTTNTNGEYILHGLAWAVAAASNASSPLFGRVDLGNVIVAGHSMGATCAIMAGKRLAAGEGPAANVSVRLVVAQHPGICGPFGPPPWPSTWMPADLRAAAEASPVLLTTATNDGAFWPAPHTAEHELGCVRKAGLNSTAPGAAAVEFSSAACQEDGAHPPWTDGGHDCPFKTFPEAPWVLTAFKLYGQQQGRVGSACFNMLWGTADGSLARDQSVQTLLAYPPASTAAAP